MGPSIKPIWSITQQKNRNQGNVCSSVLFPCGPFYCSFGFMHQVWEDGRARSALGRSVLAMNLCFQEKSRSIDGFPNHNDSVGYFMLWLAQGSLAPLLESVVEVLWLAASSWKQVNVYQTQCVTKAFPTRLEICANSKNTWWWLFHSWQNCRSQDGNKKRPQLLFLNFYGHDLTRFALSAAWHMARISSQYFLVLGSASGGIFRELFSRRHASTENSSVACHNGSTLVCLCTACLGTDISLSNRKKSSALVVVEYAFLLDPLNTKGKESWSWRRNCIYESADSLLASPFSLSSIRNTIDKRLQTNLRNGYKCLTGSFGTESKKRVFGGGKATWKKVDTMRCLFMDIIENMPLRN